MVAASFDVSDKVVFVTGAGRGIGRGIAEVLADAGADIALNARTPEFLEPAATAIAEASGRRVLPVAADMANPDAVAFAVDAVLAEFGRIDVLVNAVGDALSGSLVSRGVEEMEHSLDVNLRATLLGCRTVGAHLIERGAGKVINISSVSGARGGANLAVYAAAKAAIEGLTRALALEWAPFNVNVNCIAPGFFPDPRADQEFAPEILETFVARIPLGRLGDVHDVGRLALFLASPASDYLTGQTISLDGGMSL